MIRRCFVCFFKQKTAYEMRISDWSSDVCSSDLDDVAIAFGRIDIGDALPAATGAAIFIGARTLAIAVGGHRQDELLVCREFGHALRAERSEEHTSELQSLMRITYAVFCLKKNRKRRNSDHK